MLVLLTVFILPLNSFTAERPGDAYVYIFQVCGDAGGMKDAGLVQKEKTDGKVVRIGNYNQTRAIKGSM